MNIICPICTECVLPNEDLCANSCGHVFHYPCIRQWIERSKTCPTCRKLCSDKHLIRIYFTVSTTECTEQDVVNLERKLEILNQNYQETAKAHDQMQEELKTLRSEKRKSAKTIIALEDKLTGKDFALRSTVSKLKRAEEELLELQEVKKELSTLKEQMDQVQAIEIMLTSNQTEVQDLLTKQPSHKTLAYMVSNLKRDLVKSLTAQKDTQNILIKTKNALKEERERAESLQRQVSSLESENFDLQRQLKSKRQREDDEEEENKPEKRKSSDASFNSSSESPVEADSDSPYLRIQSSAVGLTPILHKPTPKTYVRKTSLNAFKPSRENLPKDLMEQTIFKFHHRPEPQGITLSNSSSSYISDGMGGLEKKEHFPEFPSRTKSTTDLNSTSIRNRIKSGILKNPTKKS
uniref:Putative e3 ubiquitin-protein ligase traip n=1 Tax=Lutzomyia longipalpis TaxID=7200 RepID=A0A1B0CFY3_LUTLO